jgi:hypothetical protein
MQGGRSISVDPGDEALGLGAENRSRRGIDLMDFPIPILP